MWSALVSFGIYIEMAPRRYPMYSVCIVEAILASFVFCTFCQKSIDYKFIKKPLMQLGSDSIIIFYLHHCDWIFHQFWFVEGKIWQTVGLRVLVILLIYLTIVLGRSLKNRIWSRL